MAFSSFSFNPLRNFKGKAEAAAAPIKKGTAAAAAAISEYTNPKKLAQQKAIKEQKKRIKKEEKKKKNEENELTRQMKKMSQIRISRRKLNERIKPPVNKTRKQFPNDLKSLNDDEYNKQLRNSLKAYYLTIIQMDNEINLVLEMKKPNIKKEPDIDDKYLSNIDDNDLKNIAHRIDFLINFLKNFYIKEDTEIEIEFIPSMKNGRIMYKNPDRKNKLDKLINDENKSLIRKIINKLITINEKINTLVEEYYSLNEIIAMVSNYRFQKKIKTGSNVTKFMLSIGLSFVPFGTGVQELGQVAGPIVASSISSATGLTGEKIIDKTLGFIGRKKKLSTISENDTDTGNGHVIITIKKPKLVNYCDIDKYNKDLTEWLEKQHNTVNFNNENSNSENSNSENSNNENSNSENSNNENSNSENSNNENSNNESIMSSSRTNGGSVKNNRNRFRTSRKRISRARSAP